MQLNQIKYQDPATKTYLGSPSIIRLDSGDLLASHDYFGICAPGEVPHDGGLSSTYRSSDDGLTWTELTHIYGLFWANLFKHRESVYILGCSCQYGSIVIRRSDDGGATWTYPTDQKTGLLFTGGYRHTNPNYHCAPMPVLEHEGRLYRAFEDCRDAVWGSGFMSTVISCDADADLLDGANWIMSNKLRCRPEWVPAEWGEVPVFGWLEGNCVVAPNGEIWNILRVNSAPAVDKAAIVKVHEQGRRVSFDPQTGLIDFPGGMTKFTIRRCPRTGLYLTISNNNTDPRYPNQRNVLCLNASEDLLHWRHVRTLLEDDLAHPWEDSIRYTGFQYVDWQFDGEDIIYMVRCAHDGAHNFHDANRMTFGKVEGYTGVVG